MPAYIHGSLAVEQRTENKVKPKEVKKTAYRGRALPVQEKLLYLFTVAICVVVAGLIIWRYAQIYEMNMNIKKIENDLKVLQAENSVLKHKVDELSSPQRLGDEARRLGLGVGEDNQVKAPAAAKNGKTGSQTQGVASNTQSGASADKKTKDQP